MKIIDAKSATDAAKTLLGEPNSFQPQSCKKVGRVWFVTATIGFVDTIEVTVKVPERLTSTKT